MRAPRALQRLWRGERGPASVLLGLGTAPLSALFAMAVRVRNLLYDTGLLRAQMGCLPVVSIGNLAVGGTGKTPVSGWLVHKLTARGWKPGLVTRGYGEDELSLHRRWNPDAPVIASRRRIDGVREAANLGRDIVVMDDGFQHRRLRREVDVVLFSPAHKLPPRLLPRGPFRESLGALKRANWVLVTAKGPDELGPARSLLRELRRIPSAPRVEIFPMELGEWETLEGTPQRPPSGPPLVLCSIANPEGFLRVVEARLSRSLEALIYPDHHPYDEGEIARIAEKAHTRWIATTEKDAVKLARFAELLPPVRVLPLVPAAAERLVDGLLEGIGNPESRSPTT